MADTASSHPSEAPDRGYYALLGVGASAGDDEIKRAYRQLATTLHPDKVADAARRDEASHLFTRIQEAYEVGAGGGWVGGWGASCGWVGWCRWVGRRRRGS